MRSLWLLVCAAAGLAAAELPRQTIFAFDDYSIPFQKHLALTMVRGEKYPGNPVVARGPAGSVDSYRAQFYGSVIRVGSKLRMWYAACNYTPRPEGGTWANNPDYDDKWNVAYAESTDGIHWTKPDLGLTSFNNSRHNNLVELPRELDIKLVNPLAAFVLYEPGEKDPSRRYKMAMYGKFFHSDPGVKRKWSVTIYPLFSADGLRWKLAGPAPRAKVYDEHEAPFTTAGVFEIGGLYKFDGVYYVTGQQMSPDTTLPNGDAAGRTLVTHCSGDFVHWTKESSYSFQRYGYRSTKMSTTEEAHEGASIWNRGNVLLGLYGMWHGAPERDRWRLDLGLLVSNDGIHYREPVADHAFLVAGDDKAWDRRGLLQGQGFLNMGEKTYIYFGAWDLSSGQIAPGEIGLATIPRDRFGFLSARPVGDASFLTAPLHGSGSSLSINADGLSETAYLTVELLDRQGAPIAGYSGAGAAKLTRSGLSEKVVWPQRHTTVLPQQPFRLHVRFVEPAPGTIRFYAAYRN